MHGYVGTREIHTHIHIHIYANIYMYVYIQMDIYIYIYIYMCMLLVGLFGVWWSLVAVWRVARRSFCAIAVSWNCGADLAVRLQGF